MNSVIKWMATNHVASNLLMMVLIVGGAIKMISLKQEVFPEVTLDMIQISVVYPGAGPEEVEEGIILKIEDNLTGISGIKEVTSSASEGIGNVMAEIDAGEDADRILQEIKSEVDRIITFPQEAEKPVITKLLNLREVISVVVYGDVSDLALREQAETIREELLTFPKITQVELGGVRPFEISIEIDEESLLRYGLTLGQVSAAIRRASLDLPGGNIKTAGGEILLRTKERRYSGSEYADIVVIADKDGSQVRLGDLGVVKDSFEENNLSANFDGKPAAMVKVFRVADQKPTEISDIVKQYVGDKESELPGSLHVAYWKDESRILRSRIDLLTKNAVLGLILVLIVLGLFLDFRLAMWVMLGIPISFFGAIIFLPSLGVSINMMSLFAFILALGILVDDAIVVGESIFEQRQRGKPYAQAAIDGVIDVATPVVFSILTTIAAFSPLLFISGIMGKFMKAIPLVVISLLIISLVECLLVLPAHLSNGKKRGKSIWIFAGIERVRHAFSQRLKKFIHGPYKRTLHLCLSYRYIVLSTGFAILFVVIGIVKGGLIKFSFMPEVEGDAISVSLRMPPGTPIERTDEIAQYIISRGMETVEEMDRELGGGDNLFEHIYAVIGGTIALGGPQGGQTSAATHLCDISMMLKESDERHISTETVLERWREKVGSVSGIDYLTFSSNLMHLGADIDVQLAHSDYQILQKASERLKEIISAYPGVEDLKDTYVEGKQELKLTLKPAARTLGITEQDLAQQVRSAFYGSEALRLQIGRNEVKVMVRYPEEDRKHLSNFDSMRIKLPSGGEIPISQAAEVSAGRGYSKIDRSNRKRVISVQAKVNSAKGNAKDILNELKSSGFNELSEDYPGLSFNLEGEEKRSKEVMGSMADGFLLAILAIYALMALPFRSYIQPILIMVAIPFGIVGAIMGHIIMGYQLSILSFFGVVALSGVVVNDALILIDKINQNRRAGMSSYNAVIKGSTRRFRPILLTSLTTFFGLMPMIMETSVQARFLIPMAISLGFGIMFATGITLILIPSLYMIMEDFRGGESPGEKASVPRT